MFLIKSYVSLTWYIQIQNFRWSVLRLNIFDVKFWKTIILEIFGILEEIFDCKNESWE